MISNCINCKPTLTKKDILQIGHLGFQLLSFFVQLSDVPFQVVEIDGGFSNVQLPFLEGIDGSTVSQSLPIALVKAK